MGSINVLHVKRLLLAVITAKLMGIGANVRGVIQATLYKVVVVRVVRIGIINAVFVPKTVAVIVIVDTGLFQDTAAPSHGFEQTIKST